MALDFLLMPRFIVPPKYVYSQEKGSTVLVLPNTSVADYRKNGMLPWLSHATTGNVLIAPVPTLPSIGNGHDCRTHSKITVTSIRWKLSLELSLPLLLQGTLANDLSSSSSFTKFPITPANCYQYPPNPNQFYKFRYMMIEFDEDLPINPPQIFSWFYSTYCFYRNPTADPKLPLPTETPTTSNCIPGPISVHSNIMRITTPWVGKFKILADKCFEVTANRPRVNIDITVPINRVYTWNDELVDYDQDPALITPHIYCIVLPPLSFEQDMSIFDKTQLTFLGTNLTTTTLVNPFINWQSWMKLNFVDI